MSQLKQNFILSTDSYKLSHGPSYPEKVTGMHSYIEARSKGDLITFVGLQMYIKKYLLNPITVENIDEAESFAKLHGEPFNRKPWEKIVSEYNGFIPVKIRAVKEGSKIPSGHVLVTVECTDPDLFWLSSYVETSLQRSVWYPTTIASNDYKSWRLIKRFAAETCDDLSNVPFGLHDFGGRGVSSSETAEIGGMAHLVYFMGSDTIEGIRAANFYYNEEMSAFSVPASEHSIQCSYGETPWGQERYLNKMIDNYAKPGSIVSIVLDGYDVYREAQQLCQMRDKIKKSGAKVVFRPDSGDPLEVIPRILKLQELAFGVTTNSKGFKVLNNVGILQGDGVDYDSIQKILETITQMEYASSNIVFGSGGALLQKVNRDTYKFAQKASAILIDGQWKDIFKNPITDPGKKSKTGRLTLLRSKMNNEYLTGKITDKPFDSEFEDVMQTVYENGKLVNETTLAEIRKLAQS